MDGSSEKCDIVTLLARHEETIGQLYRLFADKYEGHGQFWSELANEEYQHAEWIGRLNKRIQDGAGRVRQELFDRGAIEKSLDHINNLIDIVKSDEFSCKEALAEAMKIEESILEKKYYEIFEGNIAEIKQVQYCLEDATREHRERVRKALSEIV